MDWLHPFLLIALLAAPMAAALFWWAARQRSALYERFATSRLGQQFDLAQPPRFRRLRAVLLTLTVALWALGLAGPRFGTQVREVERSGIDLVIALDVSNSMRAEDVAPSRLDRAKREIKDLLPRLEGDRIGLVVFAGSAFLQCPLTTDYDALRLFLEVVEPEMVATQGTNLSAAYATARDALSTPISDQDDTARSRAILFVTDGENHAAPASRLADEARSDGIALYAAGVGTPSGAPVPQTRHGETVGYKERNGRTVVSKLDRTTLQALAGEGAFFEIGRTTSTLDRFSEVTDRLQQTTLEAESFVDFSEQYQWPLGAGLLCLLAHFLLTVAGGGRLLS